MDKTFLSHKDLWTKYCVKTSSFKREIKRSQNLSRLTTICKIPKIVHNTVIYRCNFDPELKTYLWKYATYHIWAHYLYIKDVLLFIIWIDYFANINAKKLFVLHVTFSAYIKNFAFPCMIDCSGHYGCRWVCLNNGQYKKSFFE